MIHIDKGIVLFMALQWLALILGVTFPGLVLWLPRALFGAGAVG